MRRVGLLVLLLLMWCLFAGSPAIAQPFELFFEITPDRPEFGATNPGTISYAGGTAPLVGSNIGIFFIEQDPGIGGGPSNHCLQCTLSFSTGSFAGTIPAQAPGGLANYSFSGGGSLQIRGGVNFFDGTAVIPSGTTLLTGVPTDASTFQEDNTSEGLVNHLFLNFEGALLNPNLLSHYGFPADASLAGTSLIATTEMSNAPNPFVLSTFTFTHIREPSFVQVRTVPLPTTLWPFAVGFVALAVWRKRRKAFTL